MSIDVSDDCTLARMSHPLGDMWLGLDDDGGIATALLYLTHPAGVAEGHLYWHAGPEHSSVRERSWPKP